MLLVEGLEGNIMQGICHEILMHLVSRDSKIRPIGVL